MDKIEIGYQIPEILPYKIRGSKKEGYTVCQIHDNEEILFCSGQKPVYLKSEYFKTLADAKKIISEDAISSLKQLEEKLSRQLKIVQKIISEYDEQNDWIEDYRLKRLNV